MNKFADRLRKVQRSRNMTQVELARLIEISPGTLSAYLREDEKRKVPTLDTLERIAEKLGVTIGWLCGEDGTAHNILNIDPWTFTYAHLFEVIDALAELTYDGHCPVFFTTPDSVLDSDGIRVDGYRLFTPDQVFEEYYSAKQRIDELYQDGTIDDEMYDGWREKRMKKYADQVILRVAEVESCPEDVQPMAAEHSPSSDQTDAGK